MLPVMVICVALFVCMTVYYSRSEKPVKKAMIGMGSGLIALGAAKLLLPLFGLGLPLNLFNVFLSVILGPPGVVASIILHIVLG